MAQKSEVVVLGCHLDDPATRSGMKKVLTKDKASGLGQKTLLIGDYGVASMCKENQTKCQNENTILTQILDLIHKYSHSGLRENKA